MGNTLKVKIIISVFSILLLMSIALIENNFYKTPTYKRWSNLEWNDFNGITSPFTDFDAAIFSDIYLEQDSLNNTFRAYAAQNNQKSWKKDQDEDSDDLLNHEQYHFNIAEVYARKMNTFIKENPGKDYQFYEDQLSLFKIEEQKMQDRYDQDSDHSILRVNQVIWEYKIDSLLQQYSDQTGVITDYYSGAQVYFSQKPEFQKGMDSINESSYRSFELQKYDMELSLTSFQYLIPEFDDIEQSIKEYYEDNDVELKSFEKISVNNDIKIFTTVEDTSYNILEKNTWLYSKDYLYKLVASYPLEYQENFKYVRIVNNFMDSFNVINTDDYWLKKFQHSDINYRHRDLTETKEGEDCLVYGYENQYVFFRGPIFTKNGALVLVQNIPSRDKIDIKYNFLRLHNHAFQYKMEDTQDQFLKIPFEKVPKNTFEVEFGFVPDSTVANDCYEFNYQTLEITPPSQTL